MHTGMLWQCLTKKPLSQHVAEAASHYNRKHGRMPELCLVNPTDLSPEHGSQDTDSAESSISGSITVRPWRYVLPGHLWIGIEEMPTEKKEVNPT